MNRITTTVLLLFVLQPVGHAKAQSEPTAADFYQPDQVQTVRLQVDEDNLRKMMDALPKRIYVPATMSWRNMVRKRVALRFKGNSSSRPEQRHKRSFLVRFDKYDPDGRFLGLQRISFDNGIQFGGLLSEPIITDILGELGVKTHRSNYAKVYVNDDYKGVYVNVERIDAAFIANHLGDPQGALFKVDEGGPGCNLQFLGRDPLAYQRAFEAKSDSATRAYGRLVTFIQMINQSDQEKFASMLEENLELDDFLHVTAVMLMSGAFDQLTGFNPHNYYLFFDSKRQRWRYIPWDLDVGFCETAFQGQVQVLAEWHAAWPTPPSRMPNPLLNRLVSDPRLLKRYRTIARKVAEDYFRPERIEKVLDAKYALIKEALTQDPFPRNRVTHPRERSYDEVVKSMKEFARKRYATTIRQLDQPGDRPSYPSRGQPNPFGGIPAKFVVKIRQVERHARQMQRDGKNIRPIQEIMERLPRLFHDRKWDEAAKALERALQLAAAKSSGPDTSKENPDKR